MSEEKVLTLRGKRAVWAPGGGSGPIDPKRLPEGYPYNETRVTVDMSALFEVDGAVLCKVSDNIPEPIEQGAQLKVWRNGESGNALVTIANNNYLMASEAMVFVSFADNITFEDFGVPVSVPEKGVYFLHVPGMLSVTGVAWDSTAIEPDITWDGVVETIHPMAPEFLPALTSPNGTKYQLTVADDGALSAVKV